MTDFIRYNETMLEETVAWAFHLSRRGSLERHTRGPRQLAWLPRRVPQCLHYRLRYFEVLVNSRPSSGPGQRRTTYHRS